ncbi:MAG: glycoside hydrolase family 5 protein [Planctomycetes bacterium]|nr:glycoside hydrolase family 5 protein [Planctomycetota bacterium]
MTRLWQLSLAATLWTLSSGVAGARLEVKGSKFALDGRETFLVGMSYYGALGAPEKFIEQDLDDLKRLGFNWVRVWATWAAADNDVSAVAPDGKPREPYLAKLKWLVEQADKRGMVVDVTLSRGNGVASKEPRLASLDAHLRAVETLATALKPCRNVYFDVGNERNIKDRRHVPFDDVKALRDRIKQLDPDRLVTASHAGELTRDDVEQYLAKCQLDFLSPHRPRNARSPQQTAEKTRECLAWAKDLGRVAPVHHQEPFRRDFGAWQPKAADFLADARGACEGGAAGWCLHNGSAKDDGKGPRRSFDLREKRLFDQLDAEERQVAERLVKHVAQERDKEAR